MGYPWFVYTYDEIDPEAFVNELAEVNCIVGSGVTLLIGLPADATRGSVFDDPKLNNAGP